MRQYSFSGGSYELDRFPDHCPRCTRLISPTPLSQAHETIDGFLEVLFRCPHCKRLIISIYEKQYHGAGYAHYLRRSVPSSPVSYTFPLIDQVSNRFSALYNQSSAAESYGLNEIAGTGYRKTLEFLVKDYCIALHPSDAEAIKKKFLKNVIDDYLDGGKLKTAATLTTWLGNDEGHYERRWVDADLQDLKALLNLTVTFVNEEVQLQEYVQRMKPTEPPRLLLLGPPAAGA
jgi:hypothetical protein